ncbi:hypothetical protein C8R46DRAFT_1341462 [Mycena filopes]|nr:hypothetical protein C8R46DRAFT_1341462 [Mycena filopes]
MSTAPFVFHPLRDNYYLDTVTFKVENVLFKIPKWQFETNSGVFATTFSLPQSEEKGEVEGSDDEHPFRLDGISRVEFQTFLKVLYPLSPIAKTPSLFPVEWIQVLKLASLWDFVELRTFAIEQLNVYAESLDCIARIQLGRDYDVSTWIRSGYTELARRRTPITSDEASKIGFEVALQIYQLREAAAAPASLSKNPFAVANLGTVFEDEFKRADSAHELLPRLPRIEGPQPAPAIAAATASGKPGVSKRKVSPGAATASSSSGVVTGGASPLFSFTARKGPLPDPTTVFAKPRAATVAPPTNTASAAGLSEASPFGKDFNINAALATMATKLAQMQSNLDSTLTQATTPSS